MRIDAIRCLIYEWHVIKAADMFFETKIGLFLSIFWHAVNWAVSVFILPSHLPDLDLLHLKTASPGKEYVSGQIRIVRVTLAESCCFALGLPNTEIGSTKVGTVVRERVNCFLLALGPKWASPGRDAMGIHQSKQKGLEAPVGLPIPLSPFKWGETAKDETIGVKNKCQSIRVSITFGVKVFWRKAIAAHAPQKSERPFSELCKNRREIGSDPRVSGASCLWPTDTGPEAKRKTPLEGRPHMKQAVKSATQVLQSAVRELLIVLVKDQASRNIVPRFSSGPDAQNKNDQ
jgi:hypothetical protein